MKTTQINLLHSVSKIVSSKIQSRKFFKQNAGLSPTSGDDRVKIDLENGKNDIAWGFFFAQLCLEPIEGIEERSSGQVASANTGAKNILLECYPNPASDELTIRFNVQGEQRLFTISFTDMNGRTLKKIMINEGDGDMTVSFDTGDFVSGMYFVRLETEGEYISGNKVVIYR